MTIAELVDRLSGFRADQEVGFAVEPLSDVVILSVYEDILGKVWIDIGEAEQ